MPTYFRRSTAHLRAASVGVSSELCNLVAAILCTIGAAIGAVALFLSEPTFVNYLAAIGAAVGALGGIVWIIAAVIALRQKP